VEERGGEARRIFIYTHTIFFHICPTYSLAEWRNWVEDDGGEMHIRPTYIVI